VTVKVSDQNVASQVLRPRPTGDIVLASAHSRELAKQGWKGAFNNLPACYLTGLILGKKALTKGIQNAILYVGKDHFTSRVAACLKGIVDSGVQIPVSEESLPPLERLSGRHIAEYAKTLKGDQDKYRSRFSALLKNGLEPEEYPAHFEEIRNKISAGKFVAPEKVEKKEKKVPPVAEKPAARKEKKKAPVKEKKERPKKEAKKSKKPGKGAKGKKK
jgi:large subunit ribosomal protein L18